MFSLKLIGTVFYGLISIVGGAWGYWKTRSKISLISGGISGVMLLILSIFIYRDRSWAAILAAAIITLLIAVFIIRFLKTKKPIPALPMILLGVVSLILTLS